VRSVRFSDQPVGDTPRGQALCDAQERGLVGHREDDGVGVLGERPTIEEVRALTRRMGEVGREEPQREVVANNYVVVGDDRAVGRGRCGGFSELAGCSYRKL